MSQASIVISKLSKRYPKSESYSLKNLSLQVQPGEVYGFLGANGAGKSTTIRLLLNFIQPTSGSAQILGKDIVTDRVLVKRSVGYLSGDIALYSKVTGKQFFDYMAALQPLKHAGYLNDLVGRFEVELDKPLETLSKGNRQKIGLLQAFMHEPDVLILDEPTTGLDPLMQEVFFALIAESKQRGAAIFLSSHNLAEAQRICDRVGILKEGKLIREQSTDQESSLTTPIFRITLANPNDAKLLKSEKSLRLVAQPSDTILLMQPTETIAKSLQAMGKYSISEFVSQQPDLENEFLEFYGDAK